MQKAGTALVRKAFYGLKQMAEQKCQWTRLHFICRRIKWGRNGVVFLIWNYNFWLHFVCLSEEVGFYNILIRRHFQLFNVSFDALISQDIWHISYECGRR